MHSTHIICIWMEPLPYIVNSYNKPLTISKQHIIDTMSEINDNSIS